MPLTPRKALHLRAMVRRMNLGRTQPVILTTRLPDGGLSTLTLDAIWRVQIDGDPTYDGAGAASARPAVADVVAMFDAADISLAQLKSCLWASPAPGAPGIQPASHYTLLDIEPAGILPGSTRIFTRWTRQR